LEDGELLARARGGDAEAERLLYEQHVDRVYRLAFRLAADPDLAEEFTQMTFVRAFEKLGQFRGEAAFSSWLHSIAVSVTISGLRKIRRRRRHEVTAEDLEALAGRAESTSGASIELRRRLHDAIGELPDPLRIIFVMYYAEGYRHREISEVLGIPEGTSKARLFRARDWLRSRLGGPCARESGAPAGSRPAPEER
jgi:RNA polymerase sigma-70 factor (ECF subfamily)